MKRFIYLVMFLCVALGVSSCSKGSEVDTNKIKVNKEVNEVSENTKQAAPSFELLDVKGKKKSLMDYKGKVVVVNFFNSWSLAGMKEIPDFMKVGDMYRDKGVEVIYISPREKKEDILQYLKESPTTGLNILLDTTGDVEKRYGVESIPTTYIIDRDGNIFARLAKAIQGSELEELIKSLL